MDKVLESLLSWGAVIQPDRQVRGTYVIIFTHTEAKTTIRIGLCDPTGAGAVITNITTLPEGMRGHGFGSHALEQLLAAMIICGLKDIRAVQVQERSERFWIKNNFIKVPEPNPCNDYQLVYI